jgi:hypothetical protein
MAKQPHHDPADVPTVEADGADLEAVLGRELASVFIRMMQGMPAGIAYNVIGNLTVSVFAAIPFANPADILPDFDRWADYTREMLGQEIKDRLH